MIFFIMLIVFQVFNDLDLKAYDLSVDRLDVHAVSEFLICTRSVFSNFYFGSFSNLQFF